MSDYERAAERIWGAIYERCAFQRDIAAILREELPERAKHEPPILDHAINIAVIRCPQCGMMLNTPVRIDPAPDVTALRDIAKRTFKMLDEGATLREKQELYNLCRSLLRSEPKEESHE